MVFHVGISGPYSVVLYSICCIISIINLTVYFLTPYLKEKHGFNRSDKIKIFTWIFLFLHSITAIYTTIYMVRKAMAPDIKITLSASCFFSLVYNILAMYLIYSKMSAIAPREKWIGISAIFCVSVLKV